MVTTFVGVQPNGRALIYADGPPLLASDLGGVAAQAGDIVIASNVAMSPSGSVMWRCISGGSPGTWQPLSGESKVSVAISNAAALTLNGTPVVLVPAQGPGTLIEVISLVLEAVFKTAAFTGGSAIAAYYTATTLASATIAATVLTTFSATQMIMVAGALAVQAGTTVLNAPIVLSAASTEFANAASGASTLVVKLTYRVHSGL